MMKTVWMISSGIGMLAATALAASAHAAPPCFDNDTEYDAEIWHIEQGEKMKYGVAKPGEKICAEENRDGYVAIAFKSDQPPYFGNVAVVADGLVKVEKDAGGYFLVSLDGEGKQVMKHKLAQPQN
jgi:hypothetical protein